MPKIVDHAQRRRDIVDALWRVVDRDGMHAVSVRKVAAEVGMAKSNIGHYVGSQSQLIALAVADVSTEVAMQVLALDLEHLDVESATEAFLKVIPMSAQRRRQSQVWLLLLATQDTSPDLQQVLSNLNTGVREGITTVLQAMVDQDLVHPDRDIAVEAARLHGLIDGLAVQTLTDADLMPVETIGVVVRAHVAELQTAPPV